MEKVVKDRVLEILEKIIEAVKDKDASNLRELSNQTVHNSSIFQDEDSISIAILAYALSKIIERYNFNENKEWFSFYNKTLASLKDAQKELIKDRDEYYKETLRCLFKGIDEFDHKLAIYVQKVIEKSKIKKGSAIFEHGISLGRVSELLGVLRWDLMDYIGKTNVFESDQVLGVRDRLNFARKLFGL